MKKYSVVMIAVVLCFSVVSAFAGWNDMLNKAKEVYTESTKSESGGSNVVGSLSSSEIVSGLKEALHKAVDSSVSFLGKPDGFLKNTDVKIPVPESLGKVETALRLVGQNELADEFVTSMNRAAEKAVPETVSVLGDAIKNMSFDDAKQILGGPDNAATEYFKKNSGGALAEKIKPIITAAMSNVDVTGYYNKFASAAKMAGMTNLAVDLESYVTDKSLSGLYLIMEREEANIRKNPVARTTELLQKVFGQ